MMMPERGLAPPPRPPPSGWGTGDPGRPGYSSGQTCVGIKGTVSRDHVILNDFHNTIK
jgi:hypothetical protein